MNSEQPPKPIKYKKPPIVERVLTFIGDVSPEVFYSKFEAWKELIHPHFPQYDPLKDWKLNIELKDGIPLLTDAPPEVQITHRFFRHNAKGKKLFSMRVLPNQLTLCLHRDPDVPHYFEELFAEAEIWLPQWFNHFGIKGCSTVTLDYINVISAAVTPQFVDAHGSVLVGGALTVFSSVPSKHMGIIPPYDCQMGLMIDPKRQATFALRVVGLITPPQQGSAVRVDFHSEVSKNAPSMTVQQSIGEAQFLHTIIIDQFEVLFTPSAKKSFEPV